MRLYSGHCAYQKSLLKFARRVFSRLPEYKTRCWLLRVSKERIQFVLSSEQQLGSVKRKRLQAQKTFSTMLEPTEEFSTGKDQSESCS